MLLTLLGFAALLFALFAPDLGTTQILIWMGVGALLIFFGVALLAARIARPLAGVLGFPLPRMGGVAGRLARDNAQRNPQRTASTASALMIGLALVTLVATLAAGITSTFTTRSTTSGAAPTTRSRRRTTSRRSPPRSPTRSRSRRASRPWATSAPARPRRSATRSSPPP